MDIATFLKIAQMVSGPDGVKLYGFKSSKDDAAMTVTASWDTGESKGSMTVTVPTE